MALDPGGVVQCSSMPYWAGSVRRTTGGLDLAMEGFINRSNLVVVYSSHGSIPLLRESTIVEQQENRKSTRRSQDVQETVQSQLQTDFWETVAEPIIGTIKYLEGNAELVAVKYWGDRCRAGCSDSIDQERLSFQIQLHENRVIGGNANQPVASSRHSSNQRLHESFQPGVALRISQLQSAGVVPAKESHERVPNPREISQFLFRGRSRSIHTITMIAAAQQQVKGSNIEASVGVRSELCSDSTG